MRPLTIAVASALPALAPALSHADDMSYRYFQIGYLNTNTDISREEADGIGTRGSFGFAENFFVFTEINRQQVSSVDVNQYAVGLGGHVAVSDNVDVVGRVGWARAEFDGGEGSTDGNGYVAGAGIRAQAGEHAEFEVGAVHYDFGSGADDTGAEVAARWNFNKRWALALEYSDFGDLSTFMVGVRINFGVK
jgi:hypothetical protein